MRKGKNSVTGVMMCLLYFLCALNPASYAQQEDNVDPELLDELIGAYRVIVQELQGAFIFIKEDGKLKGAPAGEEPSELELVEGEEMTFVGHTPDGTEQFFKFLRNKDGKVAKCILSIPDAGLVVEMFKLEK